MVRIAIQSLPHSSHRCRIAPGCPVGCCWISRPPVEDSGLLRGVAGTADEKSWVNNWIAAEPIYRQAELVFIRNHEPSKALYAHVSEIPAQSESSISVPAQLAELTADLSLPQAQDPETRLRIPTILGMLEVNYDSAMARATWAQVEALARQRHHYLLASGAIGEQGIAAFLLGDIATAKKNVVKAWTVAKVADPAAHIRYASVYGTGLVELQKYGEALLRVLQEKAFERVGSNHPIEVDVRLIAATNRDLKVAVADGTFRQDLFYRLNVFPIVVPPLRERTDDIPLLVEYFVGRFAKAAGKRIRHIGKQTMEQFTSYDWPGNIRELQNVVERAVILSESDSFVVDESWLRREPVGPLPGGDSEVKMIEAALAQCHGRVSGPSGAAVRLGIPRQTLESKIRQLGIDKYRHKRPPST